VLLVSSMVTPDGAQEAFGRVAIEGLASGLAVVVSATGGLQETVGDAGWTVPAGNKEALASRILGILEQTTPADVRCRARARAEEYSIETMWDMYADLAANSVHR
jgi:glycosyltransferase involved in cell wall biosynthesis